MPTSGPNFDQQAANALIHEIGKAIMADERYKSTGWDGVALVINFEGRRNMFGYVYSDGNPVTPRVPSNTEVIDLADELREVMSEQGDPPFFAMLAQLKRPGPKLKIDFAHEPGRWKVGPDNFQDMMEKLRPR